MHQFRVRFFKDKEEVANYLINAPNTHDANDWAALQIALKHSDCDHTVEVLEDKE